MRRSRWAQAGQHLAAYAPGQVAALPRVALVLFLLIEAGAVAGALIAYTLMEALTVGWVAARTSPQALRR